MNARIQELAEQAGSTHKQSLGVYQFYTHELHKLAELIVQECVNRKKLLGAIRRGWCGEKNSHKTMDSDLALAIFDEVEKHIRNILELK